MSDPKRLHPLVAELIAGFTTEAGELRLAPELFSEWWGRLRALEEPEREPVAIDLAVVAARFRRERPGPTTDWAVHALIFFGIELVGSPERARAAFEAVGLRLEEGAGRFVAPVELVKQAPGVVPGRTRTIAPALQNNHLRKLR